MGQSYPANCKVARLVDKAQLCLPGYLALSVVRGGDIVATRTRCLHQHTDAQSLSKGIQSDFCVTLPHLCLWTSRALTKRTHIRQD